MAFRASISQYLDRLTIARRRNLFERVLLRCIGLLQPSWPIHRSKSLSELLSTCRVSILSPSDAEFNLYQQLLWGDTWAKYELTKALGEMGYLVTDLDPDVVIHLFGKPAKLPPEAFKIVWIYSHPERIKPHFLRQYDRVFCLSSQFTQRVRDMGFEAEWAPGATARVPCLNPIEYDIVFVGNARSWLGGSRQIITDLGHIPYNLKVWGRGWDEVLPKQYIGGEYFDYTSLDRLYSSALISLSDHSPEMREAGFVALRVFDILASGGFCISDANTGLKEVFGDTVPQYHSPAELRELVDYYMQNPECRLDLMQRGQRIALSYSWTKRAGQFMRGIDTQFQKWTGKDHNSCGGN